MYISKGYIISCRCNWTLDLFISKVLGVTDIFIGYGELAASDLVRWMMRTSG